MFLPTVFEIACIELNEASFSTEPTAELSEALGTCEHCGAEFFDGYEELYHAHAECIGAEERFDTRFEF